MLLDTGPLGKVTHPKVDDVVAEWFRTLLVASIDVRIPEIADYELRRELTRAGKEKSIERLDQLEKSLGFVPITTEVMRKAAQFWAVARNEGEPTAHEHALDGDVILAAQADYLASAASVTIATTNVGHLSRFVSAKNWSEITPNNLEGD